MPFLIFLLMIQFSLMQRLYNLRIESSQPYLCHNFLLKGNKARFINSECIAKFVLYHSKLCLYMYVCVYVYIYVFC